jgi:uroporphyrin-III C-methyltransferase
MSPPPLLTAQDASGHVHLIIGSGSLAGARCSRSIDVGAKPIVIARADSDLHFTLARLVENGSVDWVRRDFRDSDLETLGREEVANVADAVFVTCGPKHPYSLHISSLCRRRRIPVNVVDAPNLCTFTLLTTYSDGPLQIGITTSGRGCKLASRIRREIVSCLPPRFGEAIDRLGTIRRRIWEEDHAAELTTDPLPGIEEEDASPNQKHTFNTFVSMAGSDPEIARNRRIRWLSQICEYWPLYRLASITDSDISTILQAYTATVHNTADKAPISPAALDSRLPSSSSGQVTLAGSGPGSPSLLTLATHTAIQTADFILADKLVPAPILDLIPRRTPVHIARKFPGNAEAAQEELLQLGLDAAKQGRNVLRLKQGDPYLYGRGAEELAYFRSHGLKVKVLPGVTSALSGPLFAKIPVTHRAVADQVLICTGTGRKGQAPNPPEFNRSQTVVFLMALHRLEGLVASLTVEGQREAADRSPGRKFWPRNTPCAVVERASCSDQRVIRSTLEHVCAAVEEEGSRPPGLFVLGWTCEVLFKSGGQRWIVEDGYRELDDARAAAGLEALSTLNLADGTTGSN